MADSVDQGPRPAIDTAVSGNDELDADTPEPGASVGLGRLISANRVEAFSDGVLAIAITLLALDLKAPEGDPGSVAHSLLTQWPAYVAYLASFIYVGVIWINHHTLFTRIRRVDNGVLWRNLVMLLPVSVLPFPTATLAFVLQHGTRNDQYVAIVLYGGVAAAMGATWLLMFTHLDRHPGLLNDNVPKGFFREERRRATLGILGLVVAIAVGGFLPVGALVVFLFLPLFYAVTTEGWLPHRRWPQ